MLDIKYEYAVNKKEKPDMETVKQIEARIKELEEKESK